MKHDFSLRLATGDDAGEILRIYAPHILNTSVTFETQVPSLEAFSGRMAGILGQYPYLVCEVNGAVAGYAYACRAQERAAYGWNAELSVYVDPEHRSKGVASALYRAILPLLKAQNVTTVYAVIALPNDPSVRFHESLGFEAFARFESTGYKLGAWHDVLWMQRRLNQCAQTPTPVIPFSQLDPQWVQALLA